MSSSGVLQHRLALVGSHLDQKLSGEEPHPYNIHEILVKVSEERRYRVPVVVKLRMNPLN